MADKAYTADKKPSAVEVLQGLSERLEKIETVVEKASKTPARNAGTLGSPNYVRGSVRDSAPYSILKAASYAMGYISADEAKEEVHVHNQLQRLYKGMGWNRAHEKGSVFLVPYSTDMIPDYHAEGIDGAAIRSEIKQKMFSAISGYDPDEARWIKTKAAGTGVGTVSDIYGGSLVGFPTLGELIDLQRNMEVFSRAGATSITLPPNARMQYPKLTNGTTAYWVGEAGEITSSRPSTGYLDLIGKKLAVFTYINNELIRYASPSAEGMVRTDMAAQAALKADLAMLEGTGGTQPKGLITYESASSWTQGQDKLLTYTVTSNKFQPEDVYGMQGILPDMVQDKKKSFVMRNDLWGKIRGRRADAITAADGKGTFVFNITRTGAENIPNQLDGYDVVCSSQISNTRSSTKTYVLCGAFEDWLIGRFGVMEFLMSNTTDTAMAYDQTVLRAIQIMDAGARHASSFVFADAVDIA